MRNLRPKNEMQMRKSIAMPDELWHHLTKIAKKEERSTSSLIRLVLQDFVSKTKAKLSNQQ